MRRINLIVVHCAATRPSQDIGAAEIDTWHRKRGFAGIGYHYVIRRDGTVETGRPIERTGAHALGYNHDSIGICLVGGLDEDGRSSPQYTDAQITALASLDADLSARFPNARWCGHGDLPGVRKDCPCFDVAEWCASGLVVPVRGAVA